MTTLFYRDLAVVGFGGTVQGECGYAVAVARHKPTKKYIRLSFFDAELKLVEGARPPGKRVPPATETYTPKGNLSADDKSTVEAFRDEGRLTLFRKGLEFPAVQNAMVLYVAQPLLDGAGVELPQSTELEKLDGTTEVEKLDWELLSEVPKVWVTCATVDSVFLLMDSWGRALRNKCVDQLVDYIVGKEKDKGLLDRAERTAEMGLGAARDDALRQDLFLLYGVTVMYSNPREVADVFEAGFLPEFKDKKWTWPAFDQQLQRLVETLRTRATAKVAAAGGPVGGAAASPEVNPSVRDTPSPASPSQGGDVLMYKVEAAAREIKGATGLGEKIARAVKAAEFNRQTYPPGEAETAEIIAELERKKDHVKIESEARLRVFASDPFFYLLRDARHLRANGEIHLWDYLHLVGENRKEYLEVCGQTPLAFCLLKRAEKIPDLELISVGG